MWVTAANFTYFLCFASFFLLPQYLRDLGASKDEIVGPQGDQLKIRITAPPVDGRANAHLIAFLAGVFGVPKTSVRLIRGARGRNKVVEIREPSKVPLVLRDTFQLPSSRSS